MNTRLLLGALATAAVLASPAHAKLDGKVPEPGMVTFVTFSADGCQPCRLMEPALRKLDQEYEGRAAIREITREVVRTMAEDQRRAHPHCSDETLTLPDLVGWDDLDGSSH